MRLVRRFKLQDFCLQVVVDNLEKYIESRNIPQKHVDFLLRRYSKDVFKKFSSITNISEDQMLWFLNPHSKKVALCTISERIMNRLKVVGQTITSLSLRGTLASENMINSIICCVPTVTRLYLSSSYCSDKTLLCIQRMCPFLRKLDIHDCRRVTAKGMKNLCGPNKPLKHLNLLGTSVDLDGVHTILKGMPSLQSVKYCEMADVLFDLHAQDFQNETYSNIHYCLTELLYECEGMHDPEKVLMAWTSMCPNVTKLHIKFNATMDMLEICSRFKHLEDLQINFAEDIWIDEIFCGQARLGRRAVYVDDTLAPFLDSSSRLTTLTLCNVIVSLNTLVQCYKSVKNLTLRRVTFGDIREGLRVEENNLDFLHMRSITLSVDSNSKAVSYLLSASKNVTKLRLNSFRDLPQEAFDVILKTMKNLEFVDFSFTPIKTASVLNFLEIPTMKAVYLDICYNLNPFDRSDLKNFIPEDYVCTFNWHLDYSNIDSDDEC